MQMHKVSSVTTVLTDYFADSSECWTKCVGLNVILLNVGLNVRLNSVSMKYFLS